MKTSILFAISGSLLAFGCGDNIKPCDRTVPGNVCTVAGNGQSGYSGEEGPALSARLSAPMDTLTAPDGSVFVVDWNNHRIRKVTSDGMIHFVAGNGEIGGDLNAPLTGDFNHPTGLLFDPTGTLLYLAAWHNSKVRIIDPATGTVTDSCGDGARAYKGDEGPALTASLDLPTSLAWSPDGKLTIMDQANQVIRQVDSQGVIHRIAGNCVMDSAGACPGGVAATACPAPSGKTACDATMLTGMTGLCTNNKPCAPGFVGDDIPALDMRMGQQFGQQAWPGGRIAYDKMGNLFFADPLNNEIRFIDTAGMVHAYAGVQGSAGGYSGDGGPALQAHLNHPVDLAFADDGTLYFSDVWNHCIRKIAPDKTISTVAGQCGMNTAAQGEVEEGIPATQALFNIPHGIEWVAPSTLYIADTGNNVIRVVNLQ